MWFLLRWMMSLPGLLPTLRNETQRASIPGVGCVPCLIRIIREERLSQLFQARTNEQAPEYCELLLGHRRTHVFPKVGKQKATAAEKRSHPANISL